MRDKGGMIWESESTSHGEPVRRTRSKASIVTDIWLAGANVMREKAVAAEIERRDAARKRPPRRPSRRAPTLLHHRLDFGPKSLARGVARIEHVAARIDHKLDARRLGKGGQLVEQYLRAEIRGGEIEQPMRDQDLQLGIERQDLPQFVDRLRWPEAAAEIPDLFHRAIAE